MTGTLSTPETGRLSREPDSSLLDAAREIAPIIRAHSEEAERERRLSQPVLKALRDTGLLRMTTPLSLGGLETDPITRALVVEEIGRHDSAAAWTLENPLDWAFFCARLPDEGAEEIYSGGAEILIAGQVGRPLNATSTDGGYRISGRAPFVSNCHDAAWIMSTVLVDVDQHAEGEPEKRIVYFPREQCEIIDTWDVMGMRGTGSNDISVTDVDVPNARTFPMVPDFESGSHYQGPLYRLPLAGMAATGIPTPMLGGGATCSRRGDRTRPDQDPSGIAGPAEGTRVGASPAGPSGSDPALRAPAALRHGARRVAEMHRRRDPLPGAEGGTAARHGTRDEQRRPGRRARLQHRGNDGVSSH
jgi:indole-3-acetate monooxygenase